MSVLQEWQAHKAQEERIAKLMRHAKWIVTTEEMLETIYDIHIMQARAKTGLRVSRMTPRR